MKKLIFTLLLSGFLFTACDNAANTNNSENDTHNTENGMHGDGNAEEGSMENVNPQLNIEDSGNNARLEVDTVSSSKSIEQQKK